MPKEATKIKKTDISLAYQSSQTQLTQMNSVYIEHLTQIHSLPTVKL
jgi:hypothetical protein